MFKCNDCGYNSATKLGKCPNCGNYGSFLQNIEKIKSNAPKTTIQKGNVLSNNLTNNIGFFKIENIEFKRVFNRGIKKSGIYLLGGEPGIGKSTIILQIIDEIIKNNKEAKIGYFSGEENSDQINDRISRLNINNLNNEQINIFHSTKIEDIITTSKENNYNLIIIDSIQTIYKSGIDSPSGSLNQVKICSEKICEFCKSNGISSIIIGHVTKDGEIAGPKYLEHIVDAVLYLEGDRFGQYRFLRSKKNRFESTDDLAIFEMTLFGLSPVYDIKERIINSANTSIPGNVLTVGIDNSRPVIVNLEVLINKTKYKYPQRTAIGIDNNRLNLVIAILERYLKLNLGIFDIYVNIPGEFKFFDSGLDLSIAAAILLQYKNKLINKNLIWIGELGLGGQILKSKIHEKRVKEIPNGFEVIDFSVIKNIIEINNIIS